MWSLSCPIAMLSHALFFCSLLLSPLPSFFPYLSLLPSFSSNLPSIPLLSSSPCLFPSPPLLPSPPLFLSSPLLLSSHLFSPLPPPLSSPPPFSLLFSSLPSLNTTSTATWQPIQSVAITSCRAIAAPASHILISQQYTNTVYTSTVTSIMYNVPCGIHYCAVINSCILSALLPTTTQNFDFSIKVFMG